MIFITAQNLVESIQNYFDYMQVLIFHEFGLIKNAYSRPQNVGIGDLTA